MYACLTEKKKAVVKIKDLLSTAKFYAIFKFSEFTANEMSSLRFVLRESNSTMLVLKNTIFKLAVKETFICDKDTKKFHGQLLLITAKKNEQLVSKKINTELFNKKAILLHAVLGEKLLTHEDIKVLATTPDIQDVLCRLTFTMNNGIFTLVKTTRKPIEKLLMLFSLYSRKKQKNI